MKTHHITTLLLILFASTAFTSQNNQNLQGVSIVINEFQADPAAGLAGDANRDNVRDTFDDEFVELYNNSANSIDISGWTLSEETGVKHTFPSGSIVEGNCSIVVFGGGTPTGAFGFSVVQTASSGSLGLNNSGDSIILRSGPTDVATYVYEAEGGNNQSLTRDPVATGLFIDHSISTGSGGSLFSPGTNTDGSNYSGCTVGDLPPMVSSTTPSNLASGADADTNITINFTEDVTIMPNAFEIECQGNTVTWTESGSTASSITLDPTTDLPSGFCSVTALASLITDLDDNIDQLDGNGDTVGGDNYSFSFIVGVPELEIWEIQGDSTTSIYAGFDVSTKGNIVTALDTLGFYMQTPDNRDDGNINTSNGLFVYIDEDPTGTISVGDEVDVDGPLVEFFELTEFSFANVVVVSSGNPLPTPILLDDNFPPNDPTIAPCSTDLETHKYECLENMYFDMPQGFISAGSAASNPIFPGADGADVLVRAGSSRAFREPGIDFPGDAGLPDSPVFDGNPEILEMDIDSLTLPLTTFAGGTEVSIKGIFGFEFDEYEIWPSEITVINENVVPGSVRDNSAMEVTVASANLFRFFNDVNDPGQADDDTVLTTQEYQLRLTKLSKYFREDLKAPMIIGLQEIENIDVLNDLATQIEADGGPAYTAELIEGNDIGGIDVGFMYQTELVSLNKPIEQLGDNETQSINGFTLHDRPPLYLDADVTLNNTTITAHVLVVHFRSRSGIDGSESTRIRQKRFEQAISVANMIDNIQTNNPNEAIITLGDFNAFNFTDGYADIIGQITGTANETENEYYQTPIFESAPLTQAIDTLPIEEQYSFVFGGSAQLLDNALLNDEALLIMNEIQFARGQSDVNFSFEDDLSSLRVSDHDGFVLYLSNDVIFINGFE
ncbi:MAG: lamin tail domain-containing protein [Marinicellaceae bacterium]